MAKGLHSRAEELRTIRKRCGDGARGIADRLFLLRSQERFHARDELRREPGQREQHQGDERQAEADAVEEPRVHR